MGNDIKINIIAQDSTGPGVASVEASLNKVGAETTKTVSLLDQLKGKFTEAGTAGTQGFGSVASSASGASSILDSMHGGVSGLTSLVGGLGSAFGGVAAVLAGGAIFNESIQAFRDEAAETKNLMNTFGLTADAASNLRTELAITSIGGDDFIGMAMKFDRQLKTSEGSLNALGVATRDNNGALLDQKTLLENAASTMMTYQAGTDRNEVAMRLFGRSASDAFALLKLNEGTSQRAAELTQIYGLALDDVALKSAKDYKTAMAEVKLAGESVAAHMGEAIVPALTEVARIFSSVAEEAVPLINNALELAGVVFLGMADIARSAVSGVMDSVASLVAAVSGAFAGDMPADFYSWENAMKIASTGVVTLVAGTKVAIDSLVWSAQQAGIAMSVMAQLADMSNWGDPQKEIAILKKGWEDSKAASDSWTAKMADNAKTVESSMGKIWMSGDNATESIKKQGKAYTDTAAAQKDAKSATDDGTEAYNRQASAFNALIDENSKADAVLSRVAAATLNVQQAEDNLTTAEAALKAIREENHQIVLLGVQDGVDYLDLKKKEEVAEKTYVQAKSESNRLIAEATKNQEELQKAIAASITQNGELVPNVLSVKDAQTAANVALSNWNTLSNDGVSSAGAIKAAHDQYKLSLDNLAASNNNLKVATASVSTAVTDVGDAYTRMTGSSIPNISKISTAITGMKGDLNSTLAVGIAVADGIGGAFGNNVSKVLSIVSAINSVASALNNISTLANSVGQTLGLVTGSGSGTSAGSLLSAGSTLSSIGSFTGISSALGIGGSAAATTGALASAGGYGAGAVGASLADGAAAIAEGSALTGGTAAAATATEGAGVLGALGSVASVALPLAGVALVGYGISQLFTSGRDTSAMDNTNASARKLIEAMAAAGNETAIAIMDRAGGTDEGLKNLNPSSVTDILPTSLLNPGESQLFDHNWESTPGEALVQYIEHHQTIHSSLSGVPTYATGGYFGGGLRIVGEIGPELEATGPSRIYNHSDTMSMLDNSKVVEELRELKELLFAVLNLSGDHKVLNEKIYAVLDRVTIGGSTIRTQAIAA